MHTVFADVIWIVCGVGLIVGLMSLIGSSQIWDEFGKNGLFMDRDLGAPAPSSAASQLERDTEIRQMLEARNARRLRRGEELLDVEEELARLTGPAIDDELRAEIRDMVVARNHRRARKGQPPLDVESEIEREIANLSLP